MKKTIKGFCLALLLVLVFCVAVACGEPVKHKVTFDADGGSAVAEIYVVDGEAVVNPPHSVKDGYSLKGWSKDGETTLYDFSTAVKGDLALKAVWEKASEPETPAEPVTVTFKDGDETIASVAIEKGGKVYAPDYSKEGKNLEWKNGETQFDFATAIQADLTLTAEFTPIVFDITVLDFDGTELDVVQVNWGEAADLSVLEPTHFEYPEIFTFSDWDKPVDCVKENMTVTAVYDYKALPDELFDFRLLSDGTYELKVKRTLDFRGMNLTGAWGVPSHFNNRPVSRIGAYGMSNLYKGFDNLSFVYVPETVKVVDAYAFNRLSIPRVDFAGLEEIWAMAFFDCTFELNLPASLSLIEPYAFFRFGLVDDVFTDIDSSINIDPECENFVMTDGVIYSGDGTEMVFVDHLHRADDEREIVVPDTVKTVYPALLWRAWGVTSMTFKGNVDTIGSGMFYDCNYSLQSVTFNGTVKRIEGAETVYDVKGAISAEHAKQLRVGAFMNCGGLSESGFTLPRGLRYVGDFAFCDAELAEVRLDGVEYVGEGAFYCYSYEKFDTIVVTNSDNYYSYLDRALIEKGTGPEYDGRAGDTFLVYAPAVDGFDPENAEPFLIDTYTVPDGVTAFDTYAFNRVFNIKHLVIPEGVRELPGGFLHSSKTVNIYNTEDNSIEKIYFGVIDISLPSTLQSINSYDYNWLPFTNTSFAAITVGPNFTGFLWPNDCNLKKIEYFSISSNETEIEIPASVTDYQPVGYASMWLKKTTVEDGNSRYVSFGGWLYEKIGNNELRLLQIPRSSPNADGALVFPDTGDYVLTEIASSAAYGVIADRTTGFKGITEIVFPETVRIIHDSAFDSCSGIKSVTFPAGIEYIGKSAFAPAFSMESVTFNGVLPPRMGDFVFDALFSEPLENAVINVPNGNYTCWFEFFAEYAENNGINYAKALAVPETYTYRFNANGGTEVADKVSYDLWELPYTGWNGEGTKHLQGWFTKDGTETGDWGLRVGDFEAGSASTHFVGTPVDGTVNLYARWEDTRYEDGSGVPYAFVVSETPRQIHIDRWVTTFFEFTPERDGLYLMKMDFDHVVYSNSGFGIFDAATDTVNGFDWTQAVDENGNTIVGYECKAGQTYYIFYLFEDQNVYTAEFGVEGGDFRFTVEWQGEIPPAPEPPEGGGGDDPVPPPPPPPPPAE